MTMQRRDMSPIAVADIPDGEARAQVAALCWRIEDGRPEVLLVTSRETGRWVVPKGWSMKGKSAAEAARREAWEEAGAEGRMTDVCLGVYAYTKVLGKDEDVPCIVELYPLKVKSLARKFPERAQRRRRWFGLKKAAQRVDEPELKALLLGFDPKRPKRKPGGAGR